MKVKKVEGYLHINDVKIEHIDQLLREIIKSIGVDYNCKVVFEVEIDMEDDEYKVCVNFDEKTLITHSVTHLYDIIYGNKSTDYILDELKEIRGDIYTAHKNLNFKEVSL